MANDLANLPDLDLDRLKGELSRRDLKEFIKQFWSIVEPSKPFQDNWHIDCFCDHLAHIFEIKNLLINLPPRSTKTIAFDVMFPAWQWLHKPGTKFLYSSYSLQLSQDSSVHCRELVQSEPYKKAYGHLVTLKHDQQTKDHFDTTRNGSRFATSVGGVTTGMGGDVLVIDDPHNVRKAESEIERDVVIRWFLNSFFNRLNDPKHGARIVVGQRVHRLDLSGYILENFRSDWTHVEIPYEAKRAGPVAIGYLPLACMDPRTAEGETFWPARFPESEIKQYKRALGYATFETQYNQNPTESETAFFNEEDFRYYDEAQTQYKCGSKTIDRNKCYRIMTSDLAISVKKKADYTVLMICDLAPTGEIILVHSQRERMPGLAIVPKMREVFDRFQPAYILIENVAFQTIILEQARQEGLPVRPTSLSVRQDSSKEDRATALQFAFGDGKVWFPKDKPWVDPIIKELLAFPNGTHDDIVDALVYASIESSRRCRRRKEAPVHVPTEEEIQRKEIDDYQRAMWAGLE